MTVFRSKTAQLAPDRALGAQVMDEDQAGILMRCNIVIAARPQ
jgi:hypothetical protein